MAQYWNHSKNRIAPHQVVAGSGLRAHLKCPTCKLEWQASIEGRVQRAAGFPDCCHSRQVSKPQPTFAAAHPACLAEWDHERNQEEGFHPDVVTLGSNKQVHWICSRCPRGQPHRWTAAPRKRIGQGSSLCWAASLCLQLSGGLVPIFSG